MLDYDQKFYKEHPELEKPYWVRSVDQLNYEVAQISLSLSDIGQSVDFIETKLKILDSFSNFYSIVKLYLGLVVILLLIIAFRVGS
jgi:hypothetical protein